MVVGQQSLAVCAGYAAMIGTLSPWWAFVVILQAVTIILGLLVQQRLLEHLARAWRPR
jgi:hypothetical protein